MTTIYKSQGQTFEFVGIDLHTSIFHPVMLYMACTHVKRQLSSKVLLPPENK